MCSFTRADGRISNIRWRHGRPVGQVIADMLKGMAVTKAFDAQDMQEMLREDPDAVFDALNRPLQRFSNVVSVLVPRCLSRLE